MNIISPNALFSALLLLVPGFGAFHRDDWSFVDASASSSTSSSSSSTSEFSSCVLPLHLQDDLTTSEITLRGAIFHVPPFVNIHSYNDNNDNDEASILSATGFQMDFMERLVDFARQDNITLHWDLHILENDSSSSGWRNHPNQALHWIANDCQEKSQNGNFNNHAIQTFNNSSHTTRCDTFDVILADYWKTADRYQRVDFTNSWMSTSIATLNYVGTRLSSISSNNNKNKRQPDITTMAQALQAKATVCVLEGTESSSVVMSKFPLLTFYECTSDEECFQLLEDETCSLFARDELVLKHKELHDGDRYKVTRESIPTPQQYVAWPIRYALPPTTKYLLNRWILQAIETGAIDELYHEYFEIKTCPIGTAGKDCQEPCDANHGMSDRHGNCICESTQWTGDDCSIQVQEDINEIPVSLKRTAYTLFGINAAVILACVVWLFRFRKMDQVRASQPFFLFFVLLGCLMSSSSILALAQTEGEEAGPLPACMAIPWLYSVGFCITFGTLFAKIRRVYWIFSQAQQTNVTSAATLSRRTSTLTSTSTMMQRRLSNSSKSSNTSNKKNAAGSATISTSSSFRRRASTVSFVETLFIIVAITLVDVVILIFWTLAGPLEWERTVTETDRFGTPLESHGVCTSDSWPIFAGILAVLHLSLLAAACYMSYRARQIPTMFQEGKAVAIAVASNLQILLVGVPILFLLGLDDSATSFYVRSVIVWMNDLTVIACIFGNLMFATHTASSSPAHSRALKEGISKAISRLSVQSGGIGGSGSVASTNKAGNSNRSRREDFLFHDGKEEDFDSMDGRLDKKIYHHSLEPHHHHHRRVSSLSMASSATNNDEAPSPAQTPLSRMDMISSISLNSVTEQMTAEEDPPPAAEQQIPLPSRDTISSISLNSVMEQQEHKLQLQYAQYQQQQDAGIRPRLSRGGSSTRSVSFGMAYYSEGNEDGSELVVPIPDDDDDKPSSKTGATPASLKAERRFSCTSLSHSTPPKPPQRPYTTRGAEDDDDEESCPSESSAAVSVDTHDDDDDDNKAAAIPFVANGPPQRPERVVSNVDFDEDDDDSSTAMAADDNDPMTVSDRSPAGHGPPQQPERLPSSFEST